MSCILLRNAYKADFGTLLRTFFAYGWQASDGLWYRGTLIVTHVWYSSIMALAAANGMPRSALLRRRRSGRCSAEQSQAQSRTERTVVDHLTRGAQDTHHDCTGSASRVHTPMPRPHRNCTFLPRFCVGRIFLMSMMSTSDH